jgi:hypothetical protein
LRRSGNPGDGAPWSGSKALEATRASTLPCPAAGGKPTLPIQQKKVEEALRFHA